ncbi:NAD(P)-binding domain-containing protein [Streptomyces sp. bgisy034]|uniref:imine reductase family protein n=1 Tax=Streptomyces sp. bgisy034 TaxID=3413774 RepID=UPI003EC00CA4
MTAPRAAPGCSPGPGTALARAWLAAGHPVTVRNRTPARAGHLAAEGAAVAASAAEAVAAHRLVVLCLLDDASVGDALVSWLGAMAPAAHKAADQLQSGDHGKDVVSNLAMQVAGNATLLATVEEQGVSAELLTPYLALLERWPAEGHGDGDTTGAVELLDARRAESGPA